MYCDLQTSIPEWIIDYPETHQVFSQLGLDISCGGKSLQYVCIHQGHSPADVLQQLHQAITANQGPQSPPNGTVEN